MSAPDRAAPVDVALEAARHFEASGRVLGARVLGRGLINDTFLLDTDSPDRPHLVLQRVNRQVFPAPQLLMENMRALLSHAGAAGPGFGLTFPELIPARDGADLYLDDDGNAWRAFGYIERSRTLYALERPEQAEALGGALGRFHALVHSLPVGRMSVTRPGFHNTPMYYQRFELAALSTCPASSADLEHCLRFARARGATVHELEQARASGTLPTRIVHGDPKLDNFLFDESGDRVVGLIDLDTVQPGLAHYDIGDCLRSCANPAGECPEDPAQARFDLGIAGALLRGYLSAARAFLTPDELRLVPAAIRLIPFELGLRFLTDHLQGDRYFKIQWPGQNLHKARTQFQLVADIERREPQIRALVESLSN
jgi:Ser/Thr protein kinase RdoA (MazF antagonist)